jgi:predicted neutral ceramidase superfamily lipid hydrolase
MSDTNDYKILAIYLVFGFFIMVGYSLMAKYGNPKDLWSNKDKNIVLNYPMIKYVYILMIFLSFLSGIYLIYYFTTLQKTNIDEILIYVGLVFFLVFSTFWAYWPFKYSKTVLGLVAAGAILMLAGICVNKDDPNEIKKTMALLASSILVLQTGVFDFGIWSGLIKF